MHIKNYAGNLLRHDKVKFGNKNLRFCDILAQNMMKRNGFEISSRVLSLVKLLLIFQIKTEKIQPDFELKGSRDDMREERNECSALHEA